MRDFRDAKTMAQTLRESLTTKSVTISHSESLELVSRMFGLADWNTLSAMLQSTRRDTTTPAGKRHGEATSYPAIPLRDSVPFRELRDLRGSWWLQRVLSPRPPINGLPDVRVAGKDHPHSQPRVRTSP